jgi:hypothetical protein
MTRDELSGKITRLQMAKVSPDVQVWLKEAKELKDTILASGYMAKGEDAVRVLGVQQGIDLVLNLDGVLTATNNLGNKGIIKP